MDMRTRQQERDICDRSILVTGGTGSFGKAFVRTVLDGPDWLTGGMFGPESSLLVIVSTTVAIALLLRAARRRKTGVLFLPARLAASCLSLPRRKRPGDSAAPRAVRRRQRARHRRG